MFKAFHNQTRLSAKDYYLVISAIAKECRIEHVKDIARKDKVYIYHGVIRKTAQDDHDRDVLVKVLLTDDEIITQQFEKESALYSQFQHDHLIRKEFSRNIYFGRKLRTKRCIVLEYIDGINLQTLIDHLALTRTQLPLRTALEINIKVLKALSDIHGAGIIHQDISPNNILLSKKGQVKLIDFGVALTGTGERAGEGAGRQVGKWAYMSPEQYAGQSVDKRSDLYSLSLVLAETLLGQCLHAPGKSLTEIKNESAAARFISLEDSHLDGEMKGILIKALQADPKQRYQTAKDLENALESYIIEKKLLPPEQDIAYVVNTVLAHHVNSETIQADAQSVASDDQVKPSPASVALAKTFSFEKWLKPLSIAGGIGFALVLFITLKQNLPTPSKPVSQDLAIKKLDLSADPGPQQVLESRPLKTVLPVVPTTWSPQVKIVAQGAQIKMSRGEKLWEGRGELLIEEEPQPQEAEFTYKLEVSQSGYQTETKNITLNSQRANHDETVNLKPLEFGTVFIGAYPWAQVNVPGYAKNKEAPLSLKLPAGRYAIQLSYQDDQDQWHTLVRNVEIRPGGRHQCKANFEDTKRMQCF